MLSAEMDLIYRAIGDTFLDEVMVHVDMFRVAIMDRVGCTPRLSIRREVS